MPIEYSIDREQRLIRAEVSGSLSVGETFEYFEQMSQDENCPHDAIEIVDFSGVSDFAIRYGEMVEITRKYQSAKSGKHIKATVFNCASDTAYGIARMLKTLHEIANEKHHVSITRSEEELIQWMRKHDVTFP